MENGGTYPERFLFILIILSRQNVVQLYQLNILHCLLHLVDWKFRCCLNFRARNRRCLKKWKTLLILFMSKITVELTMKKAVMKKKLQLSLKLISQNPSVTRRLIRQNWSVTLTVVVEKKKTSTLTLIFIYQLTWWLINFLFSK